MEANKEIWRHGTTDACAKTGTHFPDMLKIYDPDGDKVVMEREEAISLARAILTHYNVGLEYE